MPNAAACIQQSGLFESPNHPFWQLTVDTVSSRCVTSAALVESSSSEEEDEVAPTSDSAKAPNPLAALPNSEAMAEYLVQELAEQPALREKFRKSAESLGPNKLWELLLLTGQKIRDNDPILIDSKGKKRTGGGVFLQLLKPMEAENKRKREADGAGPANQGARLTLRPYQAEAVKAIESRKPEKRNWVVAAPTNSGKTAIFITVARNLLAENPAAKVVVVVPTLALLYQQASAFENNGGFRLAHGSQFSHARLPVVDWFCGDKPFPPTSEPLSAWDHELKHLSVLVFEANTFLNLLRRDASGHPRARMADVDLLVLGFSASPANARTLANFDLNLQSLCKQMGNAALHVIREDDPDVKKVAPTPKDHTIFCTVRPLDTSIVNLIRLQMYRLALELGNALLSAARSGSSDCADAIYSFVLQLPPAALASINQAHSYNLLCLWLRKAIQLAASWRLYQFGVGVELLEALRKAAALCEDMGYECGLRYVLEVLVMKSLKSKQRRRANTRREAQVPSACRSSAAQLGQQPSASSCGAMDSEQSSLAALREYIHHGPSPAEKQAIMNGKAAAANASRMGLESLLAMDPCPDVEPGCVLSMARSVIAAVQEWADGLGPKKFGFAIGTGSSCLPSAVVRPFLPGGLQPPPATFGKLWSLLECLQDYSSSDNLHAIIFTRTRQGAHHLAKALQNAMTPAPSGTQAGTLHARADTAGAGANAILLQPAAVHVLVGHGDGRANAKRLPHEMVLEQFAEEDDDDDDGDEEGSSSGRGHGLIQHNDQHGMNVAQQRAVVDAFKAGGRNLLVATTAAEEGLDVPSCELVLRYSPAASGVQQVQARGRGRKEDARYVCLVQNGGVDAGGGSDHALHSKSKQEEAVLRQGLRYSSTKPGLL